MIILFTEMLRSFRDVSQTDSSREGISVWEILSYMEKHYRDCTLQETADVFGFHPVYLTTVLKEKTEKALWSISRVSGSIRPEDFCSVPI